MFDTISLLFALLPYAGYVLCFLLGCWFYRWMLKRNPAMLEKLVEQVNNSGKYAKNTFDQIAKALTGAKGSKD